MDTSQTLLNKDRTSYINLCRLFTTTYLLEKPLQFIAANTVQLAVKNGYLCGTIMNEQLRREQLKALK